MLKTISLKNIEYSIHQKPILQGVTFRCTENERICIFGENGAGKSTLLKIICGFLDADSGTIDKQGHIRFVFVPQEFDQGYHEKTIESYIRDLAGETLFKKTYELGRVLGYDLEKNHDKLCGDLSGGQQKILAMSTAFAMNPDFILLDEPENHLDIVSRRELINIMENFRGGMIFISHDRMMIDTVATKVGELVAGKMTVTEGGYEEYIQMKMERIGGLQRVYDTEAKRIKQLSSAVVIMKQKAIRGKEVSAYHKTLNELEALKKQHKESGRPDEERATKIKISQTGSNLHSGKLLVRMKGGSFKYDGMKARIFDKADLEIRSGDKIVLLGRNGSGKSTFMKTLTQELALSTGEVTWASGISYAYFDQHAEFDDDATPIKIVSEKLNCLEFEAQAALGAMRFDVARMKTAVKDLSGGERMRLRFALTFGKKPDFIILDEPTNHIDEVTWEILLEACVKTKSSILLVTHDYEFIQEFKPTVFWVLNRQTIEVRHKDLDVLLAELRN